MCKWDIPIFSMCAVNNGRTWYLHTPMMMMTLFLPSNCACKYHEYVTKSYDKLLPVTLLVLFLVDSYRHLRFMRCDNLKASLLYKEEISLVALSLWSRSRICNSLKWCSNVYSNYPHCCDINILGPMHVRYKSVIQVLYLYNILNYNEVP